MAPKKKGNKQENDDWEADLGESIDPVADATPAEDKQDGEDEEVGGGGGLLAALKKNKKQKQKKGKAVQEDYLEGEDPPATNGVDGHADPDGVTQMAQKAPDEANADEMFDDQIKKVKGAKGKQARGADTAIKPSDLDPEEEGSGLKSKKEKEKEKKEREKQRKKEQVSTCGDLAKIRRYSYMYRLQRRRRLPLHLSIKKSLQRKSERLTTNLHPPRLRRLKNQPKKAKSSQVHLLHCRNNKKHSRSSKTSNNA